MLSRADHASWQDIQDSQTIRRVFRILVQHAIILAALADLTYSAIFYAASIPFWGPWLLIMAVCKAPLYFMTSNKQPFSVFLFGLLILMGTVVSHLIILSMTFGAGAGFQYLLLPTVLLVAISGRINTATKLVLVTTIVALVLQLSGLPEVANTGYVIPNWLVPVLSDVNIAALFIFSAALAHYYFATMAKIQHSLKEQAYIDPLTGLTNRRRFQDIAAKEQAFSKRYKKPISIVLADIDHFKDINDIYGHNSGDQVLCHVSNLISDFIRETDCVCRWGGEEFLLLLPHTDKKNAMLLAERIRQDTEKSPIEVAKNNVQVTLTLGVGELKPDKSLEEAFEDTDKALYMGKSAGRNRVALAH